MTEINGIDNGRDQHGRFSSGNPGKPKGSSKNKMRGQVKDFLNSNWENFDSWFQELKPKEKVDVMIDLLPYALPRLQAITDVNGDDVEQSKGIDLSAWSDEDLRMVADLQIKYNIR